MLLSGAIPALSGLRYPLARTGKRRYNHFVPSQRADSPRQGETEEVFLCCAREKSRSRSLTACTIRRRPGSSRLPTRFTSVVRVVYGDNNVNAKSLLGVLSLSIGAGTRITITADGADAGEALDALEQCLAGA